MGPLETILTEKLGKTFTADAVTVFNKSQSHAGHAGDNGTGESHFHVEITSPLFEGKNRLDRQRMVHDVLKEELVSDIHALSLKLST